MNFIRKWWKLLFLGAIILLVVFAYINYFSWIKWGIGCQPDPQPEVIVDTWTKPLTDAGWKPATDPKPEHDPGEKFPELGAIVPDVGTAVLTASGTTDGDSIELTVIETIDGSKWLHGSLNGSQVDFGYFWYADTPQHNGRSDFSLLIESAWVGDGPDFGAGLAWEPVQLGPVHGGLFASADVNRDILTASDWAAAGVRASAHAGPFSAGGDVGYRIGEDSGLHLGVSAGLVIGI